MIPFGTIEPVIVKELRSWKNGEDTMRAVRVVPVSAPDDEPTELFIAPGVQGKLPAEGEVVNLVYGARSKGWETVVNETNGTRRRRNAGTAHSVREFVPAEQLKAAA